MFLKKHNQLLIYILDQNNPIIKSELCVHWLLFT